MKQPTAEELEKNYKLFNKILETYISEDRLEPIRNLLKDLEESLVLSPASSKNWYHGAYAGGYLVHVIKVVTFALKIKSLYEQQGGKIDFTDEELVFSALFHDLGKLGLPGKPNYLPQTSDYYIKRGTLYQNNGELDFMLVPDRSLFLLQKYGIRVSQKEYLAILLHDGLFEETNKPYYISFSPESKLKSNIVKILHAADLLAASAELDIETQND